jgi:hypothetical protein
MRPARSYATIRRQVTRSGQKAVGHRPQCTLIRNQGAGEVAVGEQLFGLVEVVHLSPGVDVEALDRLNGQLNCGAAVFAKRHKAAGQGGNPAVDVRPPAGIQLIGPGHVGRGKPAYHGDANEHRQRNAAAAGDQGMSRSVT